MVSSRADAGIVQMLHKAGLVESTSEARLVKQGAVSQTESASRTREKLPVGSERSTRSGNGVSRIRIEAEKHADVGA